MCALHFYQIQCTYRMFWWDHRAPNDLQEKYVCFSRTNYALIPYQHEILLFLQWHHLLVGCHHGHQIETKDHFYLLPAINKIQLKQIIMHIKLYNIHKCQLNVILKSKKICSEQNRKYSINIFFIF